MAERSQREQLAFDLGIEDYQNEVDDNPFDHDADLADLWDEGWAHAEKDDAG